MVNKKDRRRDEPGRILREDKARKTTARQQRTRNHTPKKRTQRNQQSQKSRTKRTRQKENN